MNKCKINVNSELGELAVAGVIFEGYLLSETKGREIYNCLMDNNPDFKSKLSIAKIHDKCLVLLRANGVIKSNTGGM